MIVDPALAHRFIASYKAFLISLPAQPGRSTDISQVLTRQRKHFATDRSQLGAYRNAAPPPPGQPPHDEAMLDAIATARIGRWIYLKDTRSYSVLLDEQGEAAYAVLGLTQALRELCEGSSGLLFEAALVPLGGRWVCDGLIASPVGLGLNLRRSFTARYRELRAAGHFSIGPGQPG